MLLGLVADDRIAEGVRAALDLEGLDHEGARRSFLMAATLTERGLATLSVLDRLVQDETLWGRLLHAGLIAGLWAPPSLWVPRTSSRVFPGAGTATPPSPRSPL